MRRGGLHGPIFEHKVEVDANYKRMLERAIRPEVVDAVELGVASHNLFDICYALLLASERGVGRAWVSRCSRAWPMLCVEPGSTRHGRTRQLWRRSVSTRRPQRDASRIWWEAGREHLGGQLSERQLEMRPDDRSFLRERKRFLASISRDGRALESGSTACRIELRSPPRVAGAPLRASVISRTSPTPTLRKKVTAGGLPTRLARLEALGPQAQLGSVIDGVSCRSGELHHGKDPSRPGRVPYSVLWQIRQRSNEPLSCAARDARRLLEQRAAWACCHVAPSCPCLADRTQPSSSPWMVMDAGKRVAEADVEVSEAIDFAEHYARQLRSSSLPARCRGCDAAARGVVGGDTSLELPAGDTGRGVLAALMAGNRVILKPALETAAIAARSRGS